MILFASSRPLERAENIKAVWDAWDGDKKFIKLTGFRNNPELYSDKHKLLVTDEYVSASTSRCIMIGHGIPATKLYGLDDPMPYHDARDGRLITYAISASNHTFMLEQIARQSGISKQKVLPLGMPRTDVYFRQHARRSDKRIYLYAPTYRRDYEGINPIRATNFRKIDEMLEDDELMIVKAHMMTDDVDLSKYKHIKAASNNEPSADYIMDCDVLITDYSSIMFDALLCDKPIVLYAKDRERYLEQRGMYLCYPYHYCNRFCDKEEELVELARSAKELSRTEIILREAVANMCDGHSTERVVELIKREDGKE